MIYDALEAAYTVLNANFATDLAALATAKGVTIDSTIHIEKRQDADTAMANKATLPVLGLYCLRATTQAKGQGVRDSRVAMVADYYAEGDSVVIGKQVELVAEAVLLSIDRIAVSGSGGLYGAGEFEDGVTVDFTPVYETKAPLYATRVRVGFTVHDRDMV